MLVGINALSISLTYANINRHHHRHNILHHHGHGCTAAPYHQQHYSTSNNCIANLISIPRGGGFKLFTTNSAEDIDLTSNDDNNNGEEECAQDNMIQQKKSLTVDFFKIALPAFIQLAAEPLAGLVDTAYL